MAVHFKNCKINGYRALDNFELKDLGDVNIIVGDNNSGKTSVLEALNIVSNAGDFNSIVRTARERERVVTNASLAPTLWESFINVFNKNSKHLSFDISCDTKEGKLLVGLEGEVKSYLHEFRDNHISINNMSFPEIVSTLQELEDFFGNYIYEIPTDMSKKRVEKIEYFKGANVRGNNDGEFIKCKYLSTAEYLLGRHFSNIIRDRNMLDRVIKILQKFDSNITDLRIIEENGRIIQMVEKRNVGYMPLSSYGDGVKRVIAFAGAIASAENGILLIDEVETGIHTKAMDKVFKFVVDLCMEYHIQLFLTTHSDEALRKFIHLENNECNMRVITFIKKDKTLVRNLNKEKALKAIEEYGQELR